MKFPDHTFNTILKAVSRSFYLSLQALPATLRPTMGMGYLLCRMADTMADTDIVEPSQKHAVLTDLRKLMTVFPPLPKLGEEFFKTHFSNLSIPNTPEGKAIEQFSAIYTELARFTNTDCAIILDVVRCVIDGMLIDLTTFGFSPQTLKALKTEADLENYLLLIGGEPGRFWTRICLEHKPHINIVDRATWIHDGIVFGKGLQLVNILRDLPKDLSMGRCYLSEELLQEINFIPADLLNAEKTPLFVPLYHQLIDKAIAYLLQGMTYLEKIPRTEFRLRLAVWWPLIFGLRTLAQLRVQPDVLNPEKPTKISRQEVYVEMAVSFFKIFSNRWLRLETQYWVRRARAAID